MFLFFSGANGEYAGLLAIKGYYESIGEEKRNVIFIVWKDVSYFNRFV